MLSIVSSLFGTNNQASKEYVLLEHELPVGQPQKGARLSHVQGKLHYQCFSKIIENNSCNLFFEGSWLECGIVIC